MEDLFELEIVTLNGIWAYWNSLSLYFFYKTMSIMHIYIYENAYKYISM
jgi:hypothetical protein